MLITSKKQQLFVPLLFLWTLYAALTMGSYVLGHSLIDGRYSGIISVTVLYAIAFLVVSRTNHIFESHICTPSVLFLFVFGFYVYAGTCDHYLQVAKQAKFTYVESVGAAYNYICIALISWIAAYWLGQTISKKKLLRLGMGKGMGTSGITAWRWDKRRLYLMILFWSVVGAAAFSVFFYHYAKGFPVLRGTSPNASPELRSLVLNEAHNISVIAFNATTMAIIFGGVYIVIYEKSRFGIALLVAASIASFMLWGARIYIALPFLVVLLLFARKQAFSFKATFGVLILIVMVGFVYGQVRNRSFYQAHNVNFSERTSIERLADLHIAPEFRDTLGVISHLDELQAEYKSDYYLQGIYLTAFPKKILTLLGIDKDALFSEEGIGSGWLIAKITRGYDWTGIRPGIIGQTLMAYGTKGVIVVFFLYGLLFSQLDRLSKKNYFYSPGLVFIYISTVVFSFSIMSTTHSTFGKFWYFTYGAILTAIMGAKRSKQITNCQKFHED